MKLKYSQLAHKRGQVIPLSSVEDGERFVRIPTYYRSGTFDYAYDFDWTYSGLYKYKREGNDVKIKYYDRDKLYFPWLNDVYGPNKSTDRAITSNLVVLL
jgi:hypothetical protein